MSLVVKEMKNLPITAVTAVCQVVSLTGLWPMRQEDQAYRR